MEQGNKILTFDVECSDATKKIVKLSSFKLVGVGCPLHVKAGHKKVKDKRYHRLSASIGCGLQNFMPGSKIVGKQYLILVGDSNFRFWIINSSWNY